MVRDDVGQDRLIEEVVRKRIAASAMVARTMKALAEEIGPRPAGSPAMGRAAGWLKSAFEDIGLRRVRLEPVIVRAVHEARARVSITSSGAPEPLACEPLYAATDGKARAPLAWVERPERLTREGRILSGKIALCAWPAKSGPLFLPPLIERIYEAGAVGLLLISIRSSGKRQAPLSGLADPDAVSAKIPVAVVAHDAGAKLRRRLATGRISAEITVRSKVYRGPCANVIGELGPARGEAILLGAHCDTMAGARGYFDNATGVAAVVAIAHALAPWQKDLRRRVIFAAFTAEEPSFQGSDAFVKRHRRALDSLRFVLTLDSLCAATANGLALIECPEMRAYCRRHFRAAGRAVEVRNEFCCSSDYFPFVLKGIPAARQAAWSGAYPFVSHGAPDNRPRVSNGEVEDNAATFGEFMLRMALDCRPLPARRKSAAETRNALVANGLAHLLSNG